MNKKLLLCILAMVIGGITGIIIYFSISDNDDELNDTQIMVEHSDLPNPVKVDPQKNPLMYDFLDGSLGYRWKSLNQDGSVKYPNWDEWGYCFLIALNSQIPDKIYFERYCWGEYTLLPPLAGEIYSLVLNEQQRYNVSQMLQNMDQNRILKEEDWYFFIVSDYSDMTLSTAEYDSMNSDYWWAGIDFTNYLSGEPGGAMKIRVENGDGYPTDWLREEPFRSRLLEEGLDLSWEWWDENWLYSHKFYHLNEKEIDIEIIGYDKYLVNGEVGGPLTLNGDQLKIFLEVNKYDPVTE